MSKPKLDLTRLDPAALLRDRDRAFTRAGEMKTPITRVLPVARAIPLGGTPRVASELRLGDLAEIQAWLEERTPHPLEGMPPAWADPEPGTRRDRLRAAWAASAAWPVRLGTDAASGALASPEGRCLVLCLALRRTDPGFGLAAALELLPRVTPAEWAGLRRVAWAVTPREEIAAELAPDRAPDGGIDWARALHRSASEGGPGYRELPELSLSQWRNLCSGGKARELSAEFGATAAKVRKALEDVAAIHVEADL